MRIGIRSSLAIILLVCWGRSSISLGQVIERDTKVTGPKGRTIERSIRTERGPGFVDRQVEIKRPHETLIRDTRIQQPGGFGFRPGFAPGSGPGYRTVVERDVVVERAPFIAPFVAPFLSFSFGSPPPPPPPPVVIVPEPVYVGSPGPIYLSVPEVVAIPPTVVVPGYAPPPPPVISVEPTMSPQMADAIGRLASFHHQSRRDGALTLGHLGDARAVGPLVARLEHDLDREVRVAAAWSLGEIADPRAALALEKASLYDKRQEVRDAASLAYRKLPKPGQAPVGSAPTASSVVTNQPPASIVSRPGPVQSNQIIVDPGPDPATLSDNPPPFPTPAASPDPRG